MKRSKYELCLLLLEPMAQLPPSNRGNELTWWGFVRIRKNIGEAAET